MAVSGRAAAVIVLIALAFGVLVTKRSEIFFPDRNRGPVAFAVPPPPSSNRPVLSVPAGLRRPRP
jgi:hypothetical protein